MRKLKLFVHIGMHKTGTTFLQYSLAKNAQLLSREGYLYPSTGRSPKAHHRLAHAVVRLQKGSAFVAPQIWDALHREIEEEAPMNLILSSEAFSKFRNLEDLKKLEILTEAYDSKFIVYLRRQDHLVESVYNQVVKGKKRLKETLHEFLFKIDGEGFSMWEFSFLENWMQVFGKDRLTIRIYEREQLPRGLFWDLLEHVGLEASDEYVFADRIESNPKFSRDVLEFLRICNHVPMDESRHFALVGSLRRAFFQKGDKREINRGACLLSPQDRIRILMRHQAVNRSVARKYMGRRDGQLFFEPWPDREQSWEPYRGLSRAGFDEIAGKLDRDLLWVVDEVKTRGLLDALIV